LCAFHYNKLYKSMNSLLSKMNKALSILLGLIFVIAPILIVTMWAPFLSWGDAAVEVIKGGIVIFIVMIGLLFLLLGISELRG